VITAHTPLTSQAREDSTRIMRACGCGLRRILPQSIPGSGEVLLLVYCGKLISAFWLRS